MKSTVWPKEGSGERRKVIKVGKVTTQKIPLFTDVNLLLTNSCI